MPTDRNRATIVALVITATLTVLSPAASADVTGEWHVTEYDRFMPENPFFGQFRYRMNIDREGERLYIAVPRTGARFDDVRMEGQTLHAQGRDGNGGSVTLRVSFAQDRFEGEISYPDVDRTIVGVVSAEGRVEGLAQELTTAQQQTKDAQSQVFVVAAQRDALNLRVAALQQQLAETRAEIGDLRKELAATRDFLGRRETGPTTTANGREPAHARTAARQAATRGIGGGVSGRASALRLSLIEPPYQPSDSSNILTTRSWPMLTVIGKVAAAAGLLSLRVNDTEIIADARGLFRAPVKIRQEGTRVDIVAIDRNGRRSALDVVVHPVAGAVDAPEAGLDAPQQCYQLGIATKRPSEDALEVCREALRKEPQNALNHYNLGVVLSRLGRHQEAVRSYQEAAGRWSR